MMRVSAYIMEVRMMPLDANMIIQSFFFPESSIMTAAKSTNAAHRGKCVLLGR